MEKKNAIIFGDSYSTFEGYIPENYATYYPRADVTDVSDTWWKKLEKPMNINILLNNSWSGSTVCNTGYGGDCSTTSSFIHRLSVLIDEGFFATNIIDRVFVFGGTNDSWTGNNAGQLMFDNWTENDIKMVLPGFACFVHKLLSVVSNDKIHIIINTGLRPEIEKGILDISIHYGIKYTQLKDVDKDNDHPTAQGMSEIRNQILQNIN